jgi:F-type H+-transporting ATPase subunit gamma
MPSTRELRRRIKSVRTTQQTTKAMEMVSSSKLRRASQAARDSALYASASKEMVEHILSTNPDGKSHPLLQVRTQRRILAVLFSSDQSLAGGYNTTIFQLARRFAKEQHTAGCEVSFITMGTKAENLLLRAAFSVIQSYPLPKSLTNSSCILPIAQACIDAYIQKECDAITLISTQYISALTSEVTTSTLLPFATPTLRSNLDLLLEPSTSLVISAAMQRYIEGQLYHALCNSIASEHGARRLAMHNATTNADDVIDGLTLVYQGIRQDTNTRDLAEITSGVAALTS